MKENGNTPISDNCPAWASEIITKILLLEVEAGTINSPGEKTSDLNWSSAKIDDLMKIATRLDSSRANTSGDVTAEIEALFLKVARGLAQEGHSAVSIANMINTRIPTGCRLPYCDASEVETALDSIVS